MNPDPDAPIILAPPVPDRFQRWLDDAVDRADEEAFSTGVQHGPVPPPKRKYRKLSARSRAAILVWKRKRGDRRRDPKVAERCRRTKARKRAAIALAIRRARAS